LNLFANCNDFISSLLDLNERLLRLTEKLTSSLDVLNKSSRKQADADRINL
jgi:hypothetical protein